MEKKLKRTMSYSALMMMLKKIVDDSYSDVLTEISCLAVIDRDFLLSICYGGDDLLSEEEKARLEEVLVKGDWK